MVKQMKKPRWYQQEATDAIIKAWMNGKSAPLVIVPTGGGKSLIQANLIKSCLDLDQSVRILCLAHRVELISQNFMEALELLPQEYWRFGQYSASLGVKQTGRQITFGQIQSVAPSLNQFGGFDVVLIDEAHLMPADGEGQYRQLITYTKQCNPNVKIGGLTATPFRLRSGYLHTGDGAIFDSVAYNIKIPTLIKEGNLVPLVAPGMSTRPDLGGVKLIAGEYSQKGLDSAFNVPDVVKSACDEIIQYGQTRKAWLIFAAGKAHGEMIQNYLQSVGVNAEFIHDGSTQKQRNDAVTRFKAGHLKCLVNVGVFTTGFNAPICDLVAILTATQSASLYVQIAGRGMRPYQNKQDCLLLDFGGNVERHGPVDNVSIKDRKPSKGEGESPIKVCPSCFEILHLSVRVCPGCEYEFTPNDPKHDEQAFKGVVLDSMQPANEAKVLSIRKNHHQKEGKPPCAKITYYLDNMDQVVQWLTPEHLGYARDKALRICKSIGLQSINTVKDILEAEWPEIDSISYKKSGKYFNIEAIKRKDGLVILNV